MSTLLALPHLLIVGLVFEGFMLYPHDATATWQGARHAAGGYSEFNLLVVIARILLMIPGRYRRPLYHFLLGLNRWMHRVLAYIALMTDHYPQVRLDTGEEEPINGSSAETDSASTSSPFRA